DRAIAAEQRAGGDITVIDWTTEERAKFREIAVEAWYDFADKSPLAKEALDAHINYMKQVGLLKE
ncbi:MAG: C4-dicarboxylate ABC transporter substrate-binding protein, partial [Pseudomonadota bacterium]